jgi:hypothetical protein
MHNGIPGRNMTAFDEVSNRAKVLAWVLSVIVVGVLFGLLRL